MLLCLIDEPVHQVRLVNGPNQHTGRVEVYTNSTGGLDNAEWGTICDDFWDINDARVVCRQLGFPDAVSAPRFARYGQGTGQIWLDNVGCVGTEPDLFACPHIGIGSHNCRHSEDASAGCSGTPQHYTYRCLCYCVFVISSKLSTSTTCWWKHC